MPILEIRDRLEVSNPVLLIAISGWVDAGMVATKVGELLTLEGRVVAEFNSDDIYDYQMSRPTVEFVDGSAAVVNWPALSVTALSADGVDLLVVTGQEPNAKWQTIGAELAGFAAAVGVAKAVAVGAVPASVTHNSPTPIMVTSTDPDLEPVGLPPGRLVVPAAMVNVAMHEVAARNGTVEAGFWTQIPQYVSGVYWPGVEAVLDGLSPYLGMRTEMSEIRSQSRAMRTQLDEAVASRPELQQLLDRMEEAMPDLDPSAGRELGDEIEAFLESLGDGEDPSV
jgi:hypothetical protein